MKGDYSNSNSVDFTVDDRTTIKFAGNLTSTKLKLKDKPYSKIRYRGVIYSIGDDVMLSDGNDGFYVAKIMKINHLGDKTTHKRWPSINVQWYYRKQDISPIGSIAVSKESISENEVFLSDHRENIIIESIISKCTVTVIEKYEQSENVFFTRATYNHQTVSK